MSELRASYESEQKSKAKLEEDLAKLRQQYEKGEAISRHLKVLIYSSR
jgi:hypothetical protein